MGILDSGSEEPHSKARRYVITAVALAILLAVGMWWFVFRFWGEKNAADRFFTRLAAGQTERAYCLWKLGANCKNQTLGEIAKPGEGYSYQDFLDDWGPSGYYGPVKSYRLNSVARPRGGSGVVITVELSPFQPFPDSRDPEKNRLTKEVKIWVESGDKSLSFPP